MKLTSTVLAHAFYWFGIVMAVFAFFTEVSGQTTYLSSPFYMEMAIVAFLAAIAVSNIHQMRE